MFHRLRAFDASAIEVVLCDADGNLYPSEEPAFAASAKVTNRFLQQLDLPDRYTAEELRLWTTGKNFRTTAVALAVAGGALVDEELWDGRPPAAGSSTSPSGVQLTAENLEHWVRQELDEVTAHLGEVLRPDPDVTVALASLSVGYSLAAVSSSALTRLEACFRATGVNAFIPADRLFSAEDSLPLPVSKPDPAVYRFALNALRVSPGKAVAIEDSVPGVASAVAAGIPTIANLTFVPLSERARRTEELVAAGVCSITDSWLDIAAELASAIDERSVLDARLGRHGG
jgi:beta-phosphoglucomutase-like phosphatase (HAD superfamily)